MHLAVAIRVQECTLLLFKLITQNLTYIRMIFILSEFFFFFFISWNPQEVILSSSCPVASQKTLLVPWTPTFSVAIAEDPAKWGGPMWRTSVVHVDKCLRAHVLKVVLKVAINKQSHTCAHAHAHTHVQHLPRASALMIDTQIVVFLKEARRWT